MSAAQANIAAGDPDKGKQFLARAQAIDSNHYRLHAIRAGLAKTEGRKDEAIKEYLFAIAHLPESAPEGQLYPILLHMNLAELYREDGNDAAAKQQVAIADQQIAKIQVEGPAKAEFLRVRASIKVSGDDFAGAEADLKEALQVDPENMNARLQYANLLWKTKRKDEARKLYTDVLAKDEKNRFALEGLGYLARDDGNNKDAEQWFTKLAAAYPNDYVAYLALGDLYTATREFDKAEQNYQRSCSSASAGSSIRASTRNRRSSASACWRNCRRTAMRLSTWRTRSMILAVTTMCSRS